MINKLIGTSQALEKQESQLQEQGNIRADELLKMEQEAEILREQINTLRQQLQDERQLVEEYRQELRYANSEMLLLNNELQNIFSVERLELDEAKRLARKILSSRQFTSESFAKLLSAIYGVVVTADQLEPLKSSPIKPPLAV
jgi:hypothetical protein